MEVSPCLLEAHDLYRFYHVGEEETLALKGVSFLLRQGEFVVVQGPSGSGKSTLLNCLAGLDEPDGGYVNIGGHRMSRKPERVRSKMRARDIGIMLQSDNLFSHLSVEENIELQMRLAGCWRSKEVPELLERLGIAELRHARPTGLSGGEAARVGLAVAMSPQPTVLLADEPTGELDRRSEEAVLELLDDYRRKGRAVLVVTHSQSVAEAADRRIELLDGKVIHE